MLTSYNKGYYKNIWVKRYLNKVWKGPKHWRCCPGEIGVHQYLGKWLHTLT